MRATTRTEVDAWWSRVLDVAEPWTGVTVRPHRLLGDYPGWWVAWRGAGVHVSVPSTATATEVADLEAVPPGRLASAEHWAAFGAARALQLRGPAVHAYLDEDPGPDPGVVEVTAADLQALRPQVTDQEWDDWWSDDPVHPVGLVERGRLVAAASLGDWDGTPRDIGVVVVPDRRGAGLAARVGRSCASWAIREHGVARWRAALANPASVRSAQRLGFTTWATQLALRPPPS